MEKFYELKLTDDEFRLMQSAIVEALDNCRELKKKTDIKPLKQYYDDKIQEFNDLHDYLRKVKSGIC